VASCVTSNPTKYPNENVELNDSALGPADTFEVRVYGEQNLSGVHQVASDGTINFPLLGRVDVAGKESTEVAQEIATRLREGQFLKEPHVAVIVQQSNSKRISVLGAVAKPGTLTVVAGMTVVQAISQAGGFSPLASKDDTVVTRRVKDKLQRFRVRMSEVTRGEVDDFLLRPGDIVFVPERVF